MISATQGPSEMLEVDVNKTQYSIADFLNWQRAGSLDLQPAFQRRSVWKPGARSFFIDTVVRGLPAPIIYLRQRLNLESQTIIREVIDGQQRLRTIFAYVSPDLLRDYDQKRDGFSVKRVHNEELAGLSYTELSSHHRSRILEYQFSTHVLPASIEDRDVLEMFARLNATGEKLNYQELRNAKYFGELKTVLYALAHEQLERWTQWGVFNTDDIARMKEVELVSDLAINMKGGVSGKAQTKISDFYGENDEECVFAAELQRRFRHTMDQIGVLMGKHIASTAYSSEVHFFSLFLFIYDVLYGLGTTLAEKAPAKSVSSGLRVKLLKVGEQFHTRAVPEEVLDAFSRASTDVGRRKTRLAYMKRECGRA